MSVFQHTADDVVHIRVGSGEYVDSLQNFLLDCAALSFSYTGCPAGFSNRIYLQDNPEQNTCTNAHGIPTSFDFPNSELELIISKFTDFMTAKAIRETPSDAELITNAIHTKINEINIACKLEIMSGFTSSALGTPHTYASNELDQINLLGASMSTTELPYVCVDSSNVREFKVHTPAQINTVLQDGIAHKSTQLIKARMLKDLVAAISSTDPVIVQQELDTIIW